MNKQTIDKKIPSIQILSEKQAYNSKFVIKHFNALIRSKKKKINVTVTKLRTWGWSSGPPKKRTTCVMPWEDSTNLAGFYFCPNI